MPRPQGHRGMRCGPVFMATWPLIIWEKQLTNRVEREGLIDIRALAGEGP